MTTHKHSPAEYGKRKAAKVKVAADHGGNANVKDRLDTLETALGIVPAVKVGDGTMRLVVIGLLAALCAGCLGCIAYRAPVIVFQRGPETNYNQERSGVQSRSTTAEQQVAETTAEQQQQQNSTDAAMASAVDETRQVGLKQGQAQDVTKATGRDTAGATSGSPTQSPTGQQGGDAVAVGQVPTAAGGGGGPGGTGGQPTGGAVTPPAPAPTPTPETPAPTP